MYDFDPIFLENFPKTYKRQAHLRPISVIPDLDFDIDRTRALLNLCRDKYGFSKYGNTVAGCTWGVTMWPSKGTFKSGARESEFLTVLTAMVKSMASLVNITDLEQYSINIHSKLGYPFCSVDDKEARVLRLLRSFKKTNNAYNLVLNRNQPDLDAKKRVTPCVLGNVEINKRIRFEGDDYKYDRNGEFSTMRMRLAFNFSVDSLVTLVADQALHTLILRRNELMHHDMSRINQIPEIARCIADYTFLSEFDDIYARYIRNKEFPDRRRYCVAADCVRFDNQVSRARQEAYGKGIGQTYLEWLTNMLDSPFILEGCIFGDSCEVVEEEDNRRYMEDIPFKTNSNLPHTKWVANQKWYIRKYHEIQLGSGLSMVAPIAKALFSVINLIFITAKEENKDHEYINQLWANDITQPNPLLDRLMRSVIERISDTKQTGYSHKIQDWNDRYDIIPLSYGDDQIWFGTINSITLYLSLARQFINLELQKEAIFLGFYLIDKVGFKLTEANYLKSFLFPEHDFGSYFRKYPATAIHSKDLDYKRLGTITDDWLNTWWKDVEAVTGFNKDNYIKRNLEREKSEMASLGQQLSSNMIRGKRYLMTKEELIAAGQAVMVPSDVLVNVYQQLRK